MLNEDTGQLSAVWCNQCSKPKRNKVLETLRRDFGWDISSALFSKKAKLPGYRDGWILGKFRDEAALLKSYHQLAQKMGLTIEDADNKAAQIGMEKAYRILQVRQYG